MTFDIRLATRLDIPSLTILFNSDANVFGEDGMALVSEMFWDMKRIIKNI